MSSRQNQLDERRDLVRRDLAELDMQVAEGEVDANTAERLRATYRAELESLEAALRALPEEAPPPRSPSDSPGPQVALAGEDGEPGIQGRSLRRMIVGTMLVIAGLSVAIFLAARDATPDADPAAAPGELLVDPESVTNAQLEAVVAANPNINAMRMALADRYFDSEEYGAALDHYLYIADNGPTDAEETKALARIGWMAYRSGLAEAADEYIVASLAIDPANDEALLFRGFITLYGLGEAAASIPQLEAARELPNLPGNLIQQIDDALADARNRLEP